MGKTQQVYIERMQITHQAPEPIHALGKSGPVDFAGHSHWFVDMSLIVFDQAIIDKLLNGMVDKDFIDSLLAQKLYLRPCCAYCGVPINVSDKPTKCVECGAPLRE